VTRMKKNLPCVIAKRHDGPKNRNILSDERIRYLSKAGWSFSNLAVMLCLNLFTNRDLRGWRR